MKTTAAYKSSQSIAACTSLKVSNFYLALSLGSLAETLIMSTDVFKINNYLGRWWYLHRHRALTSCTVGTCSTF